MRHNVGYRKLGRTKEHRRALLRNLATDLFRHERLTTTLPKARELRPFAEKLITLARRDDLHARRQVVRQIGDRVVVKKLFDTLGPRFASRPGGYTRALKLGPRPGDGADMAIVELVGSEPVFKKHKEDKKARRERKEKAREKEAAEAAAAGGGEAAGEPDEDKK
ncbi:MAG: 50S ribosomal protein L17 [Acidobacteria bacterium 13_1_40CM_2_68_5]|jgi:large subunit ribosomal protein L17|nr:MAG: 50S ribosomal protein L17 [Acidobacteria bacterium 13_1_40CM_2_68_5]